MSWRKAKRSRDSRTRLSPTRKRSPLVSEVPVVQLRPHHDQVDPVSGVLGEVDADRLQVQVADVLQIVLVDPVVDDALHVALVVADGHLMGEGVGVHGGSRHESRMEWRQAWRGRRRPRRPAVQRRLPAWSPNSEPMTPRSN